METIPYTLYGILKTIASNEQIMDDPQMGGNKQLLGLEPGKEAYGKLLIAFLLATETCSLSCVWHFYNKVHLF